MAARIQVSADIMRLKVWEWENRVEIVTGKMTGVFGSKYINRLVKDVHVTQIFDEMRFSLRRDLSKKGTIFLEHEFKVSSDNL